MNWNAKDVEFYLQEKEYIDTAVVPLIPIALDTKIKHVAEKGEFTQLLSIHLERQFKGRMLFLPPFTYLSEFENEKKVILLNEWGEYIKESGFKHTFFLTADEQWTEMEGEIHKTLLYVPSVPLEHVEESYKHTIMEDQVKSLMKKVVQGWQTT